jgi:hypothetical protein
MQKIYSLLRSNKQSGPYTLEELLQLNLKPFDLVWVEGKSGGWSYPTEIEALKLHVSGATNPTEKKETTNSIEPTSPPIIPINEKTIPSRPSSQHIYISFPAGNQIVSGDAPIKVPVDSLDESPEAKLERKAQELRNKIQAFGQHKNAPKDDNELDTKYSRSLDDIKEEYSSWLYQQQKKKKHFPAKYIVAIVVGFILLITAYYFFPVSSKDEAEQTTVLATQAVDNISEEINNNSFPQEKNTVSKEKATKAAKNKKEKLSTAKPARIYTNEEIDKVEAYLDSLTKASEQQSQDEVAQQQTAAKNDGTRQSTKRRSEPSATQISQTNDDSAPFTELLKLSESTGSGTPHLNLYT